MNEHNLEAKAVSEVRRAVENLAAEPRVVHCDAEDEWNELLLVHMSEHRLHVLARGGDIVVFFDENGKEVGWRDDGRKGTEMPKWIDRDSFRTFVVRELGLPEATRLGRLAPRELPPFGWTHEGVFFLTAVPTPDQIVRVWVDPERNHVIQCLYGPANGRGDGGGP